GWERRWRGVPLRDRLTAPGSPASTPGYERPMGAGTSLFLITIGAILDFAVDVHTRGVDLHAIGVILMIVGALGFILSLLFWNSWGGFARSDRVIVEEAPPVRRRVYRDVV